MKAIEIATSQGHKFKPIPRGITDSFPAGGKKYAVINGQRWFQSSASNAIPRMATKEENMAIGINNLAMIIHKFLLSKPISIFLDYDENGFK
jgi:hypothetical protein